MSPSVTWWYRDIEVLSSRSVWKSREKRCGLRGYGSTRAQAHLSDATTAGKSGWAGVIVSVHYGPIRYRAGPAEGTIRNRPNDYRMSAARILMRTPGPAHQKLSSSNFLKNNFRSFLN